MGENVVQEIDDRFGLREDVREQLKELAENMRRRYGLTIPQINKIIEDIVAVGI